MTWTEIVVKNKESSVIISVLHASQRCTPRVSYSFLSFYSCFRDIIYFTPNSNLIGRVEISDHHFAYSSYADDKIF